MGLVVKKHRYIDIHMFSLVSFFGGDRNVV